MPPDHHAQTSRGAGSFFGQFLPKADIPLCAKGGHLGRVRSFSKADVYDVAGYLLFIAAEYPTNLSLNSKGFGPGLLSDRQSTQKFLFLS